MDFIHITMELIIAGLVYLSLSLVIIGIVIVKKKKKHGPAIAASGILMLTVALYGLFIEPNNIVITRQTIDLPSYDGPPIQLTVLADMHIGEFNNTNLFKKAIDKAADIDDTDYYILLGDMAGTSDADIDELTLISGLTKEKPTYAVYGNHDYTMSEETGDWTVIRSLEEIYTATGITVLANSYGRIGHDTDIVLAGVHDTWSQQANFTFLQEIPADATLILLSHNPDSIDLVAEDVPHPESIDLILSGHTHGGEIQIPFIGALFPLPTDLPHSFDKGLFHRNDVMLYITSGLGNIGSRMRLGNPPEIAVITIQ